MKVQNLRVESLSENDWNPNVMEKRLFRALVRAFKKYGCVQPLLVRPVEGGWEVIDGAHRLRAAKEAGLKKVPCVVVDSGEEEARLRTLMMNRLRGRFRWEDVARMVADMDREETQRLLAFTDAELRELAELLQERPPPVTEGVDPARFGVVMEFFVDENEEKIIETAVEKARKGRKKVGRGEALAAVCEHYLRTSEA